MAVVPKQNGLNILRKLVPLNTLTEETLAELMESVAFEKMNKGDFLFHEGDTDPERVYLLSGKVALLEDGKAVDTIGADNNLARYPIAHHIPRRYSVQARTKAEIVRIDSHLLSDLLSRGGNVLYQVEELRADADDDWMSQLLQSPIFQRIPAANIQNIMMRMEEVQVTAGELVIRQGDEGDYFYLINRGQCSITRERGDGEIEEIAQLGAGHTLGEESLLSGNPRGSTVSMLTDGVLFRLGKKDFIEYIKLPLANAISYEEALKKVAKGGVWLDVRSPAEHQRIHIPKSRSVPFNTLRSVLPDLDVDTAYIIYCQDGLVSSTAVYLLMEKGLDAYVLQRGLESAPEESLERDSAQESAQIINLRPEKESASAVVPDASTAPDDEAGLLRERLQKTEEQAQEQLQRARKMKLVLEKLKGRLAEAEAAEAREVEENQRLSGDIKSLQAQLKEHEKNAATLGKQHAALEAQLSGVAGERDQLQGELSEVYQQVGKLEKRLEAKQQDEARLKQSQSAAHESLQQELDDSRRELEDIQAQKKTLEQESKRLQQELDSTQAELEKLTDALSLAQQERAEVLASRQELETNLQSLQVEADTLRVAQQQVQDEAAGQVRALNESLTAATERIASLEATLAEQGSSEAERIEALATAEKQQRLLNAELEQLRAELEGASARISELDAERTVLQQAQKRRQSEQEATLQQSLYEAVEGRSQAESALRAATDERDRVAAELTVLQKNFSQLQKLADEREARLVELQLKQQQDKSTEAEDELALSQQKAELERLTQALEESSAELKSARETAEQQALLLNELQQAADAAATLEKETAGRLAELESARQQLQQERDQLNGELTGLNEERDRVQQQLETDRQRIADLENQLVASQAASHSASELEALRSELAEVTAARTAAEAALSQVEQKSAGKPGEGGEIKAAQAELETLNDALDEADKAYEALSREKEQLQAELDRVLAQTSESDANSTLLQQKEAAEQEVARLTDALNQLREQIEAEAAERQQQPDDNRDTGVEGESGQVIALKQELDKAQVALKELELSSSADAAECEVLRQDIDKLKRSLEERSAELERTRKESLLLEEKTEERNSEIDRLKLALEAAQVDADEALFKKDEALEARKQVEESLYALQKQIEHGRPRDDLVDKSFTTSAGALDIAQGSSLKQKVSGALIGAVLAFGVAEALSVLGGGGEIISGFLADTPAESVSSVAEQDAPVTPTQAEKKPEPAAPAVLPERPEPVAPKVAATPKPPVKPAPVKVKPEPKPVAPQAAAKPSGPVTGSLIQDRLAGGGVGPEMVFVEGGRFQMGSGINQLAREEQPEHPVSLHSFSIGRYEVTFRDYEQFAAATGRALPDDLGWGQGPRPVINVSWNDAVAYTEWLSEQTGNRYRLPTEAEWEYAAAAGTDTPYWWGFDLGSGNANCFNCGSEWDGALTAPVGRFKANPFGLHNTAGNVMEWVADCYHNSYEGAPADGSSWQEAGCRERVVRGGAFNKPGESLRVTKRGRHEQDAKLLVLGFRVVRDVR